MFKLVLSGFDPFVYFIIIIFSRFLFGLLVNIEGKLTYLCKVNCHVEQFLQFSLFVKIVVMNQCLLGQMGIFVRPIKDFANKKVSHPQKIIPQRMVEDKIEQYG